MKGVERVVLLTTAPPLLSGGMKTTSFEGIFTHTILAHIRSTIVNPRSPHSVLVVELMGGQYLPTLDHNKGGVVSPYCVISIHGVRTGCSVIFVIIPPPPARCWSSAGA